MKNEFETEVNNLTNQELLKVYKLIGDFLKILETEIKKQEEKGA